MRPDRQRNGSRERQPSPVQPGADRSHPAHPARQEQRRHQGITRRRARVRSGAFAGKSGYGQNDFRMNLRGRPPAPQTCRSPPASSTARTCGRCAKQLSFGATDEKQDRFAPEHRKPWEQPAKVGVGGSKMSTVSSLDFVRVLEDQVDQCDIILAVIGKALSERRSIEPLGKGWRMILLATVLCVPLRYRRRYLCVQRREDQDSGPRCA